MNLMTWIGVPLNKFTFDLSSITGLLLASILQQNQNQPKIEILNLSASLSLKIRLFSIAFAK